MTHPYASETDTAELGWPAPPDSGLTYRVDAFGRPGPEPIRGSRYEAYCDCWRAMCDEKGNAA